MSNDTGLVWSIPSRTGTDCGPATLSSVNVISCTFVSATGSHAKASSAGTSCCWCTGLMKLAICVTAAIMSVWKTVAAVRPWS